MAIEYFTSEAFQSTCFCPTKNLGSAQGSTAAQGTTNTLQRVSVQLLKPVLCGALLVMKQHFGFGIPVYSLV